MEQPTRVNGFKGLDNRNDFAGLEYMSQADNVMLDDQGHAFRRPGYRQVVAGNCHSLWSNDHRAFYVLSGTLFEIKADMSSVAVTTVVGLVLYTTAMDMILCTDGSRNFWIDVGGVAHAWGAPITPVVAASWGASTGAAFWSDLAGLANDGISEPPLGASMLEYHKARVYVAVGTDIFFSDPFALDRFHLEDGFIGMETDITMLASVDTGMFISDSKQVYFYDGESMRVALSEPAVAGTYSRANGADMGVPGEVVLFTTSSGLCIGTEDGAVKCVTRDHVDWYNGRRGFSAVARVNGTVQYACSIDGTAADQTGTVQQNNGFYEVR